MNNRELEVYLTSELKKYIKDKGYISTGDLYNSIQFRVTNTPELKVDLNSEEYINYLEKGKLLDNFFKKENIQNAILDYSFGLLLAELDKLDI
jgi:hypothetical protein